MKKTLLIIFLLLGSTSLLAEEKLLIPDVTSTGIDAAEKALYKRKWTITDKSENEIHANIFRFGRGTSAEIAIYYKNGNLYYDGKSLKKIHKQSNSKVLSKKKEVEGPIPGTWIRNLKKDTTYFYKTATVNNVGRNQGASEKPVEERLKELDELYGKKLISDEEYKQQRQNILHSI